MSHLQNTTPGQAAPLVQAGPPLWKRLLCLLLAFQIGLPLPALAGTVAFSSIPLARASTPAAPNIMFILDDSGSMGSAYMPDSVVGGSNLPGEFAYCWDSGDDDSGRVDKEPDSCQSRDVPYRTAEINGMYYNPAVTYSPGVTSAGVSMGNQTTFTAVKTDPYLSPASTTNLLLYSDTQWCDTFGACVTNTTNDGSGNYYRYPNGVYAYRSGTSLTTNPHYFTILPKEHCKDELLNDCIASSTPTATYPTPAKVRWCKYNPDPVGPPVKDVTVMHYEDVQADCQAKRVGQYQYPKYLGHTSPGGVPTSSYATILITANPVALDQITSVMVGATNLIPGVTLSGFSGANAKRDAARALAYWISNKNQGYIACSGSGTTSIGSSSTTNPPGCNRSVGSGGRFINIVPNPGSAPDDTVYIIPTTGVGSTTPATGSAYNSPSSSPPGLLLDPVVNGLPAVIATKATGSITIGNSGSNSYVRISRVDIGTTAPVFSANQDAAGGTNDAGEPDTLAELVRAAIQGGAGGYTATRTGNVVSIEAPAAGTAGNGQAITVYTQQGATGTIRIATATTPQPVRVSQVVAGATTLMNTNVDAATGLNSQAKIDAFATALRNAIQSNTGTAAHRFTATVTSGVNPAVISITSPADNNASNALSPTVSGGRRSTITLVSPGTTAVSLTSVSDGATLMTSGSTSSSTSATTLASSLVSQITANGYSAMLNGTTGVFAYQPLGSASVATPSIVQSPLAAGASSATTTIFIGPNSGFTTTTQRVSTIAIAGTGCAATDSNMLSAATDNNNPANATALATNIAAKYDGSPPSITASGASIILTGTVGTSMANCTVTVTESGTNKNASFALTANPAANTGSSTSLSPTWSGGPAIGTAGSATAFATLAPTAITITGMTAVAPSTSAAFITKVNMGGGLDAAPVRLIPNSVNGFQGAQDTIISVRSNHGTFARVDIVPGNNSYPYPGTASKASSRTDCAGATCTYNEEMTNFANWYAYYRTRLLTMKTAAGRAFKDIDGSFRVGFMTIHPNTTDYLKIDYFEDTPTHGQSKVNQKADWYTKFYGQDASSATPLRSALAVAGRIFAGRNPLNFGSTDDPVQYSCQQNFAILTTDGMWNSDSDSTAKRVDGSTDIGNTDNNPTNPGKVDRPYFDGNPGICPSTNSADCNGTVAGGGSKFSSNSTLADVAYYYYNTDLRALSLGDPGYSTVCSATTARSGTNKFNSCCGQPKGGVYNDVCTNEVKGAGEDTAAWQHMTSFTLGLGVDGALQFKDDYKTAATGDFADIVTGKTITVNGSPVTANWPQVMQNDPTTADDLWHAAVNGHGTYYSARDPSSLSSGLANTLSNIAQLTGAGAAAATSNLEPQAGDNFAYVGSYTTIAWTGNLEARTIDIGTGTVSPAAIWCVEDVAAATVDGVAVPGCTGRLKLKVSAAADTRQIHMFDATDAGVGGNKLRDFTAGNLTAAEAAYFDNAQQGHATTGLSQYVTFGAGKTANATTANLVNYLRGQFGYEDESTNAADNRLYRNRDVTFGDVIGSQPVYVKKPFFSYLDPGYTDFKTTSAASSRDGTVYIGGNGGMLHALDALTGDERWSYVPSQMLPNLYRLADGGYSDNHRFYVDGSVAIGDVYDGTDWRTILIGGFNSGGRGYYALDITVPGSPKGLWEFSSAAKYVGDTSWDADVGYSLGNPVITKLSDGTWTVMFTSGYNNISPGNGRGYLYVLDAISGSVVRKIEAVHKSGTVGDTTTPSNLGKISAWVDTPDIDNTARYVYAGDLLGNLWRFDPNLAQNTTDYVTANPKRLAILKDSSNVVQPITTRPELGLIGSAGRIVLVGTGKYLESSDVSNTQQQTIYGIADRYQEINGGVATTDGVIPNVRDTDYTVAQTMSVARTLTGKAVDLTSPLDFSGAVSLGKTNWLVDLPESRERVNVDPQLVSGTLLVASNIPSSSSCAAGGTSFINFMDYLTGGFVGSSNSPSETDTNSASSSRLGAIIVGFVVLKLSSGKAVNVTLADSPTPQNVGGATFGSDGQDGLYSNTRAGWRELPVE
jgi:type IV pilus assembly protein PilY1